MTTDADDRAALADVTTVAGAMAVAEHRIDDLIRRYLAAIEWQMRQAIADSGDEDQDALDRPPDPDSPWRRITVEERVMLERDALMVWRDTVLAQLRDEVSYVMAN